MRDKSWLLKGNSIDKPSTLHFLIMCSLFFMGIWNKKLISSSSSGCSSFCYLLFGEYNVAFILFLISKKLQPLLLTSLHHLALVFGLSVLLSVHKMPVWQVTHQIYQVLVRLKRLCHITLSKKHYVATWSLDDARGGRLWLCCSALTLQTSTIVKVIQLKQPKYKVAVVNQCWWRRD